MQVWPACLLAVRVLQAQRESQVRLYQHHAGGSCQVSSQSEPASVVSPTMPATVFQQEVSQFEGKGLSVFGKSSQVVQSFRYACNVKIFKCCRSIIDPNINFDTSAFRRPWRIHDDDTEMQKILWQETMLEVDKGFIDGPFYSLDEVKAALGTSTVCVVRRFAILQGSDAKLKPRVIDDAKESGFNSAYTCQDKLDLHDFDYVSSLVSFIGAHMEEAKRKAGWCQFGDESLKLHSDLLERLNWSGWCLDLTKAYKQIPFPVIVDH